MMDEADAVAYQILAEKQLKKFGSFLEDHSARLISVLENEGKGGKSGVSVNQESHGSWERCPIKLTWAPLSHSSGFHQLISIGQGNPDVEKVVMVLVHVTSQLIVLRTEGLSKFLVPLILYGECQENEAAAEGEEEIARFLPVLYKLQEFIAGATQLAIQWVAQLGALFKDSRPHVVAIGPLQLNTVFREFAHFLALLVIFDEVIKSQFVLQEHWTKYRRMIKSVQADSASFGSNPERLSTLERELFILEKETMAGLIFKNFLSRLNEDRAKTLGKSVTTISEKFQIQITNFSVNLDKDPLDDFKPIAATSLLILAASLFPNSCDWKKLFQKNLLEPLKKVVPIPIGGTTLWIPENFLNAYLDLPFKILDRRSLQAFGNQRQIQFLQQKVSSLQKDVLGWNMQISTWSVKLQQLFLSVSLNELKLDDLSKRCNLLLQGVHYAHTLSQNFQILVNLHPLLRKTMSKQTACLLLQHLVLLKQIQDTFYRFNVQITTSAQYIIQHVLHTALTHLKAVQKILLSPELKKADEVRSESLVVFKIVENALRGPTTEERILVAKIGLDWALASSKYWKDEDALMILPAALQRITSLVEMDEKIEELCDGTPFLWHRALLPIFLAAINKNEMEAKSFPFVFQVVKDCFRVLEQSPHEALAKKTFVTEIEGYLKNTLVDKLNQEVETDLRLMAHSHLQVRTADSPFRVGVKELKYFLETDHLCFHPDKSFKLSILSEEYLNRTFYNLVAVALHDWQSYSTMRVLASNKYELEVMDDHLPGHSLDQGRDILEIVRSLGNFVQEFTYNLNNQVFIQISSSNKHLDSVNIGHLANSMRTHGPGMANTTVNATYQFLRVKMHMVSQFLFEEQIRSRLTKDIRLFKQSKQETVTSDPVHPSNFPFRSAEKFKNGIKKLGVRDGSTWLDHFRILITHIGNALGFVRLVRSGGLHFLTGGCSFVPDLEDVQDFTASSSVISKDNLSSWTDEFNECSSLVDASLQTLTSSFSGGVHYFQLFVETFQTACQNTRNSHLKNFYVIIPALTLSYVDHMRLCKEKLAKKSKSAFVFTDDGFPMGLAYLLQVFGQDGDFDSLNWFTAVKQHFAEEKRKESQTIHEARKDEKLEQASKLTAKRFQDQLQEFDLLSCNLNSARIFFQKAQPNKTT